MHLSVATLSNPEFINLQPLDLNPLMSACEIKVFYLGENRNRTYITKEVALEMAKTLRGCPIVGYFKESKNDFNEHDERVIIDSDGFHIDCLTKPYGFVAPDAKVWFQEFEDYDDFGNKIIRTYMMTTGYLWTGQFEECQLAATEGGRPHSMELDEDSLSGKWSKNSKTDIEFFIINDATFSKLCILGEDVEPCFEGSTITAPKISSNFSKSADDKFVRTLFSMMEELKQAIGGEKVMPDTEKIEIKDNSEQIDTLENQEIIETENVSETSNEEPSVETQEEPVKAATEEVVVETQGEPVVETTETEEVVVETEAETIVEDATQSAEYASLKAEFDTLQANYSALLEECNELRNFKADIEDKQKDELINSFYMLSDEDKADVVANKSKYSLRDIEAELSIICVRNKVSFSEETENKEVNLSYNLQQEDSNVPAWLKAVQRVERESK